MSKKIKIKQIEEYLKEECVYTYDLTQSFNFFSLPSRGFKELVFENISFDENYFQNEEQLLNGYGLILSDYLNSTIDGFIEWIEDSIKSPNGLQDQLLNLDFEIYKNCIFFKEIREYWDNEITAYINMGGFVLTTLYMGLPNKYKINVCNSYLFIEDLQTQKKYMYYGD